MDISVIVPTLNRDSYLENTLHDLSQQRGTITFEIIVIDQNATPVASRDAGLYSMSVQSCIRWIECPGRGVVYGRNEGLSVARGNILVFIDDDVQIDDSEFLSKHLQTHAHSDDDVAAICGREINPGGPLTVEHFGYKRQNPMSDILHFPRNYAQRIEATVLSTANCSIKREALLKVQGFDENFGGASYGDDADLALRLVERGYRIIYDPSPALLHLMAPVGGLRISDRMNPFSASEKLVSSIAFYLKHIHNDHKEFRLFYIYHYILRKSVLLKTNLLNPWRQPSVIWGLFRASISARESLKHGHKFSFGHGAP